MLCYGLKDYQGPFPLLLLEMYTEFDLIFWILDCEWANTVWRSWPAISFSVKLLLNIYHCKSNSELGLPLALLQPTIYPGGWGGGGWRVEGILVALWPAQWNYYTAHVILDQSNLDICKFEMNYIGSKTSSRRYMKSNGRTSLKKTQYGLC